MSESGPSTIRSRPTPRAGPLARGHCCGWFAGVAKLNRSFSRAVALWGRDWSLRRRHHGGARTWCQRADINRLSVGPTQPFSRIAKGNPSTGPDVIRASLRMFQRSNTVRDLAIYNHLRLDHQHLSLIAAKKFSHRGNTPACFSSSPMIRGQTHSWLAGTGSPSSWIQ